MVNLDRVPQLVCFSFIQQSLEQEGKSLLPTDHVGGLAWDSEPVIVDRVDLSEVLAKRSLFGRAEGACWESGGRWVGQKEVVKVD